MEKNRDALFPHVYDVLHASSDSLIQACFPEREEVQSKKETVANKYLSQLVLTQRLFLNFSELQARVDGVNATRCHRDAVDAAAREGIRRRHASARRRRSRLLYENRRRVLSDASRRTPRSSPRS